MIKKMLHHTVLSACIIGIFAGVYAATLSNGLETTHSAYNYDRRNG